MGIGSCEHSTRLEGSLKEALDHGPIFDSVELRASGMKYVVTVTNISDAMLCLISNYNGEGDYSKELSW